MDNLIPENSRFVGSSSEIISFTKWHDLKTGEFWFDLYVAGKVVGRYNFEGLFKKLQEVVLEI